MNQLKNIAVLLFFPLGLLFSECRGIPPAEDWDYKNGSEDQSCYENGTLSPRKRMRKYPFNRATEVKIISFDTNKNPLDSGSLNSALIKESFTLNSDQINELTNILYNFNHSKSTKSKWGYASFCYEPRHAILFYDSNGKMIEFMEYCFECNGNRMSSEKVEQGSFCEGKYTLIQAFFEKSGITYFGGIEYENH